MLALGWMIFALCLFSAAKADAAPPRTNANPRQSKLTARWIGQDGSDWTSTGPGVGPDGLQDVRVRVSGLSTNSDARSLLIEDDAGTRWEFGVNLKGRHNAELILDPENRSEGNLHFQPLHDMRGGRLKLTVTYADNESDRCVLAAGSCEPGLAAPSPPLPRIVETPLVVKWAGQEEQSPGGPGAVRLTLSGLAGLQPIAGAVLTDSVRGSWVFRADRPAGRAFHADDPSSPLVFQPGADGSDAADLYFAPDRDETGAKMTLRLIGDDGGMAVARFQGGRSDPGRRQPRPSDSRVVVKPGDDLQAVANRAGTVVLTPGTYRLNGPLILQNPVSMTTEKAAGVTLLFSQPSADPAWTTAIKIRRGHTTLDGFKVRFEGSIRWKNEWTDKISYGSAVIGTTDNFDPGYGEPIFNLTLTRLDLEIPRVRDPQGWIEAVRLMRLVNARNGYIAGNTLRGGPIEFFHGPWRIENNRSLGTVAGTVSPGVFGGHMTDALTLKGNWAEPQGPSGKVWRFLVLTSQGTGDAITENTIKNIGPRDDDVIPWANAPETILTEAYQLSYEGKLMGLSKDGRLIRIGTPQGQPAQTGAVVALLDGPAAGSWRTVAQAVDAATYLVDEPIPAETGHLSIARGFVGERFEHNTVDTRGGKRAVHFLLPGNHYGTRLVKNHSLGAEDAFMLVAYPTESPMIWGWSHAPFFGGTIADNVIEDSGRGGRIGVEHDRQAMKTNRGRLYMTARVDRSVIRWSPEFVARMKHAKVRGLPTGLTIGVQPSLDPGELRVEAAGNRVEVPPGSTLEPILSVPAADFNSQRVVNGKFRFKNGTPR